MEPQNVRGLYMTEKIKNMAYNFKFKAISLLEQYDKSSIVGPYKTLYLLGKKYQTNPSNVTKINKQIFEEFQKIIWFTYRSRFPELLAECDPEDSYVSDTGWGCMIRVGQMLFAELLKTHIKANNREDFIHICECFNDFDKKAGFSIQKIAKIGKKQFNLKPGQWYNPSQIVYILADLLSNLDIPKFQSLHSIVFNNANLFFDQVVEEFGIEYGKACPHISEGQIVCEECNSSEISVAVMILVRLGLDYPEKKYLQVLNQMMTFPMCRGVIGGKPQKALYFVGELENQYIYLDPHYVQDAKQEMKQTKNSYFCESFRSCKNTSIDPSLGICYYLRNISDLNDFYRKMKELKASTQDFFIFMDEKTPSYVQIEKKEKKEKKMKQAQYTQQFQVL